MKPETLASTPFLVVAVDKDDKVTVIAAPDVKAALKTLSLLSCAEARIFGGIPWTTKTDARPTGG